jgi:Kef-type K+ transport system membrane component KefB
MLPFLQFVIALVIMITAAKAGGFLSNRLGQPSVLGELLTGILLGPSVLNMLGWGIFTDTHLGESLAHLAEVGVLLLMFIAGLELHLSDLAKSGKVAAFAGLLGVAVPLAAGTGAARLFGIDPQPAFFIGLILAATSVSISAQTLMELRVLRSRVGISMLGAAVFDDVLVILGLSVFLAVAHGGGSVSLATIGVIVGRMLLYAVVATGLGLWLVPRLSRLVDRLPISQGLIAFTFVLALFYAWAAEVLGGMAAITGAFLAGLLFARSPVKARLEQGMVALAYGVFVPIFFVNVGLTANARTITPETIWLLVVMVLVAVLTKILGAGLGGRLAGLPAREALQLGVGMMSRGEVGLIVATLGVTEGLIGPQGFSVALAVVIATTLLTPPLLRALFVSRPGPTNLAREPQGGD